MFRIYKNKLNISELKKNFEKLNYLIIDDFYDEKSNEFIKRIIEFLEKKKVENDPSHLTPWPWIIRFALDSKVSFLTKNKLYPLPDFARIVKNEYSKNTTNGMYYWYYNTKPCLGKQSTDQLGPEYFCVATQGKILKEENCERICSLCTVHNGISTNELRSLISKLTGIDLFPEDELSLSLTRYDESSFLSPHNDYDNEGEYKLTFIYYINQLKDTDKSLGGELKLEFGWDKPVLISPKNNRLVLFQPKKNTYHEVLPIEKGASNSRFALSGWFLRSK